MTDSKEAYNDEMSMSDYVEKILNVKLFDYQKKMIDYLDKHPNCQLVMPRTRRMPDWYFCYLLIERAKFYESEE